jgi:O-antigen ligase
LQNTDSYLFRVARALTFASAATVLVSIAASQILLALALAALLLSGEKLRLPAVWKPIAVFLAGTLISLAFSENPEGGLPQVRKMFVFTMLLMVSSTLRETRILRRLFLLWAGVGTLIGIRALIQFSAKLNEARAAGLPFYEYYIGERITGFMSHWMTFGGQEMFGLLMLAAFVFFAPESRRRLGVWLLCGAIMSSVIILGFTRSIWLATFAGGLYLLWFRKRILVAVVPLLLVAGWFAAPGSVRARAQSMFQPNRMDSNQHRVVSWRTGWQMIRTHPLVGLGPEEVNRRFIEFVPEDLGWPLPSGWYGHLHNIYLHYAAERGIPVLLALLWIFGQALWDFAHGLRRLPPKPLDERFLLHGAIAVVIATMVAGFFELNLGDSEVLTMFLVVIASGYNALQSHA